MLLEPKPQTGTGTRTFLKLEHDKLENLISASEKPDCYVCRTLAEYITIRGYDVDATLIKSQSITAILRLARGRQDLFRLDFKVDEDKFITSFVLQENCKLFCIPLSAYLTADQLRFLQHFPTSRQGAHQQMTTK